MSYAALLNERFGRCRQALGLSDGASRLLQALIQADLAPPAEDAYGRLGVLPFSGVLEAMGDPAEAVEAAISSLTAWNLVQVVGRHATDPVLAGPAAIRLTGQGRAAVGLAPIMPRAGLFTEGASDRWLVLHGPHRERVLGEAVARMGEGAWLPIRVGDDNAWLRGAVALSLCTAGAAVVDGFGASAELLTDLLWNTRHGVGPRVLITADPNPLRAVAMLVPVAFHWVEESIGLQADPRVNRALMARAPGSVIADVCGVPGNGIAVPQRVETRWEDLIVPDAIRSQLQQAKLHAAFRLDILPKRTGFSSRGGGYRLLLSGLPGTGKSMAASALASALNRPLVRLDLSAVLSKWLGETEQLIGRIFDLAEATESVLLLDEAESLFRQRQSGPGGGNALSTAVAFLLTRLEAYSGVLVATTNRTQDVDDAFFRRFDDFIVLPTPDKETRKRLWEKMLPCGADTDLRGLDLNFLADRFTLSGGMIRGAAIRANAWSAGWNQALTMPVVLAALARELEKNDQSNREIFVEPYTHDVARLLMDDDILAREA